MKRPPVYKWDRIIRCPSCLHNYKAKPLKDIQLCDINECTSLKSKRPLIRFNAVDLGECPKCFALLTADFSLS